MNRSGFGSVSSSWDENKDSFLRKSKIKRLCGWDKKALRLGLKRLCGWV